MTDPGLEGTVVLDISATLDGETPAYPGDVPFRRRIRVTHEEAGYTVSSLEMSAHTGTHVDAPLHFLAGGDAISDIPARRWIVPARVVDVDTDGLILPSQLPVADIAAGSAVLLRTRNSALPLRRSLDPDACTLSLEAARVLAGIPVSLVGIDGLSIESDADPDYPVHRHLLERGVLILEGLRCAAAEAGPCTLIVTPLLLGGAEAAPARALIIR
jgi:arylformamidase